MANKIDGAVAAVSETGSLVTDISIDQIKDLPADDTVKINFGGHETTGIHPLGHDQPVGTLVAAVGPSGFLEIEIVGISVSEMLGIRTGEAVSVAW